MTNTERLRRLAVASVIALALAAGCGGQTVPAGSGDPPSTGAGSGTADPAEASESERDASDEGPLSTLDRSIRDGGYGNVDRLLIITDGAVVADHLYKHDYVEISRGQASALGCGVDACESDNDIDDYNYLHPDVHPYRPDTELHALESVTKMVSATVVGAAIQRGDLDGTDAPVLGFFDDYNTSSIDDHLREMTIEDLLTMQSGIVWEENVAWGEPNTTWRMINSDDWIQFTLDQPVNAEPGTTWNYNSGNAQLLAGIIHSATGRELDAYAKEVLFDPLGIDDFYWKASPQGRPDAASGLYLRAEDLAAIGELYLEAGVRDGMRILSEEWVGQATTPHSDAPAYGYHWWIDDAFDVTSWASIGFGGQILAVLPEHRTIGVVNSWTVFGGGELDSDTFIAALRASSE